MAVASGGPQTLIMFENIINEIPVGTCSTLRIRPVTGVTRKTMCQCWGMGDEQKKMTLTKDKKGATSKTKHDCESNQLGKVVGKHP